MPEIHDVGPTRYELDGRIYRVASVREAMDALAILKGDAVVDERAPLLTYRLIDGQVCIDEGLKAGRS